MVSDPLGEPEDCSVPPIAAPAPRTTSPMWPKRSAGAGWDFGAAGSDHRFPDVFASSMEVHKSLLGWRMAVLPFRAAGGKDSHSIAFGMSEEISALISRFRSPRLVAPATFWDGTGPAADVLSRCKMYELDYVLEGTLEIDCGEVRASIVLMDVPLDFEVIWNGTISGTVDDLFSLQHKIATEAVRQIDPGLSERVPTFTPRKETTVPFAHSLVLGAIKSIYRLDRRKFTRARTSLTEAIVLDPNYAAAYAWFAYWSIIAIGSGWVDDPRHMTVLAGVAADRAIQLDPENARAFTIAGHVKAYLQHDVQSAANLHERAIELNPNLPIVWAMSSLSKVYQGDHLTALRQSTISRSLSPRDPHINWAEHSATWAHFFNRNLHQAEILSDIVLTRTPDHLPAINVHLGILGHSGQRDEADHWLSKLRQLAPSATIRSIVARAPWQPDDQRYLAKGLRLAGVPA